jgi:hypothetical protein
MRPWFSLRIGPRNGWQGYECLACTHVRMVSTYGISFCTTHYFHVPWTSSRQNEIHVPGSCRLLSFVHHFVSQVNEHFLPKSTKRARTLVFDEQGEIQPGDLNQMMQYILRKNKSIKFWKHTETTRGGRRVIKSISSEVNKEMMVYVSFCPYIPEGGPSEESGVGASPMTPSTPNSPAAFRSRATRQAKLKAKKNALLIKKPRRDDMITKAKMAAEEATKIGIVVESLYTIEYRVQSTDSRLLDLHVPRKRS